MPDTVTVDGKTLKLNGAGAAQEDDVKVYVAGLYVENPSKDAAALISSSQIKSMRLHMLLRSVAGSKVSERHRRRVRAQLEGAAAELSRPRLDKLATMIPDVEGRRGPIVLTYVPGKGTDGRRQGRRQGRHRRARTSPTRSSSVWLGPNPVQDDLKAALLGG